MPRLIAGCLTIDMDSSINVDNTYAEFPVPFRGNNSRFRCATARCVFGPLCTQSGSFRIGPSQAINAFVLTIVYARQTRLEFHLYFYNSSSHHLLDEDGSFSRKSFLWVTFYRVRVDY